MRQQKKFIAVIGANQPSLQELELAEAVGGELAKRGITLICGGQGGVMEAACRGSKQNGGQTIGILPGDSRSSANPHVDIPIVTGMGYARNVIVAKSAQAVIAIGGNYGTLSEIAHALQNSVTVVGLNSWLLSKNNRKDNSILNAKDPIDAVDLAINSMSE